MQNNFRPYLLTIAILIAAIVLLQMCLPAGAELAESPSGCTSSITPGGEPEVRCDRLWLPVVAR